MEKLRYNNLSKVILDASIFVHKEVGPGLLESVYELCLAKELNLQTLVKQSNSSNKFIRSGHSGFSSPLWSLCSLLSALCSGDQFMHSSIYAFKN
jgi:hypothetical protein